MLVDCVNAVNGTDLTVNGGDPMDLSTNITLCARADLVLASPAQLLLAHACRSETAHIRCIAVMYQLI